MTPGVPLMAALAPRVPLVAETIEIAVAAMGGFGAAGHATSSEALPAANALEERVELLRAKAIARTTVVLRNMNFPFVAGSKSNGPCRMGWGGGWLGPFLRATGGRTRCRSSAYGQP